jgi:hypothetical protein
MTVFKTNQPVTQADLVVKVEATRVAPLPVGANRFRLVVVDDQGNQSDPTFIDVIVQAPTFPTAALDVVDDAGKRVDPTVPFGTTFNLSGARSTDVPPGKVVQYVFTLVERS